MENKKQLLSQYMRSTKISIGNLLKLYLAISNELLIYHQKNIVYQYLNPENIFIGTSKDGKGNINISVKFKDKKEAEINTNGIFYISPEQTGRMNIKADFSSDFYSLGCVFYEIITGYTPFYDNNISNVIYNHISKKTIVPDEYNKQELEIIWKIILKLLNKNPDNRYLNMYSLIKDLNKCLNLYVNTNTISDFKLNSSFGSNQFKISDKVFGRTDELKEISNYFKLSERNIAKLLIVSGDSGIGKSVLVKEAGKLIENEGYYFLNGKFDSSINKPYGALIEAFTNYIKKKASENNEELTKFKNTLIEYLGSNYDKITNLIPAIDIIIENKSGKNYQIEDRKICNLIFGKFIEAILYTDKKLTIFIDDFQWADEASIKLIKYLFNNIKSNRLLFIIAFKTNELKDEAKEAIYGFKNGKLSFKALQLKPINKNNINSILTESFNFYEEEVEELSSVIFEKTGGSPFFVKQFIKLLYNNGVLVFDVKHGKWIYNINKAININCTDNMIDFVLENIKKLRSKTIELITLAACIGNSFTLKFLSEISNQTSADTYIELMPAVSENFLTIDSGYYNLVEFSNISTGNVVFRFSHDKIINAFYNIISTEEKINKHLIIGENLVKNKLYLLEGVKHINIGIQKLDDNHNFTKYVKLNYEAGKMALSKAAYDDAYIFFTKAKDLLCENSWENEYELTFNINWELLRMEYIRKSIDKADKLFDVLIVQAKDIDEKYKTYELKIKYKISIYEIDEAEKYTLEFLEMIGMYINFNATKEEVIAEKNKLLRKSSNDNIKELHNLPKIKNKLIESALYLLSDLLTIEFPMKPMNFEMIVYKIIQFSLEYGNSGASYFAYCLYGLILIKNDKLIEEGYEYGRLAYNLSSDFEDSYYEARILGSFAFSIYFHKKNIKNSLKYLMKAEKLLYYQGDISNLGFNINLTALVMAAYGDNLTEIYDALKVYLCKEESINYKSGILVISQLINYVEVLLGKSKYKNRPLEDIGSISFKFFGYTAKARNEYLFGEYELSVKSSREAEKVANGFVSNMQYIDHYFNYSLALACLYFKAQGEAKDEYLAEFIGAKNKFQEWASVSTKNFEHKLLLVEAEIFHIEGDDVQAAKFYEKAADLAEENDFIVDAAVISEETSRFYTRLKNTKMELFYLKEALYYYEKWGAKGKVNEINEIINDIYLKYPRFKDKDNFLSSNSQSNIYNELGNVDLNTVIEASRAISSEIELGQLLKKLIKLLIKNAGAQEGYLLLKSENEFLIEAEYNIEKENSIMILNGENYKGSNKLSESIINYVIKTKENVILNNTENSDIFVNDYYIKVKKPKSILCTPIIYKNKLMGVLYLQNNITSNVFVEARIRIVKLLGTQAAISIENAFMYKKIKEVNNGLEKDIISNSKLLNEALEHDKLKNEFFANLSHEFRTPLNLILSSQQMLNLYINNNTLAENEFKIEKYNNSMKQNCYRLLRMVNNLIDITKIDAGFFKINIENRNIIKLVEDITLSTVPYVEERGLKLVFDTDIEEKVIACDEDAIERIILNLIANAVKFSKQGGEIFVSILNNENSILIKVKDSGIGIPKEKQDVIFDRFVQVDKSLSRAREGSGIGLALSKSLIELQGGKITVNSNLGEYSEFIIELPCRVANLDNTAKKEIAYKNNFIEKISIEFSDIYS